MKYISLLFTTILAFSGLNAMQRAKIPTFDTKINGTTIKVRIGNITSARADAIVNAANGNLQHGSGIAGAIKRAAGSKFQQRSNQFPKKHGHRVAVGESVVTDSFNLKQRGIKKIVHAVGPDLRKSDQKKNKELLLTNAYQNSLRALKNDKSITSIAFPAISTGVFGYNIKDATPVAVNAVVDWVKRNKGSYKEIRFVIFNDQHSPKTFKAYVDALKNRVTTQAKRKSKADSNKKSLSGIHFSGASVLPVYQFRGKGSDYVILSRERGGSDKGTWDDFSGGREKGEGHPVVTAAREFHEEAILKDTLKKSVKDVRHMIDLTHKGNCARCIIARSSTVQYLIDFEWHDARQLLNNFYNARKRTKSGHSKEKDKIGYVRLSILKNAIKNVKTNKGIKIDMYVRQPNGTYTKENVTLRPVLVSKMRAYSEGRKYEEGKSPKIRFY